MMKPMRIHGQWYDVSKFKHPGGPVMLSLGEGRDATALFEGHHPFTSRASLESTLKKYKLKGTVRSAYGIFDVLITADDSCAHLMDERDQDLPFVWPEFETKEDEGSSGAPVSAFAQEMRSKVLFE